MTTNTKIAKVFERQLAASKPNNGDYLGPVTREQCIATYVTLQKSGDLQYNDPGALLEQKIQEWKDHEGDFMLYYLHYANQASIEAGDHRVSVYKIWNSDLHTLDAKYTMMSPVMIEKSTMPRLQQK